ncbi:unnamed protein product [Acanthoscelides obtectus]|uniref:Uncharacterized protein n=1 Tax=Acanthoscelides obtectus TaxID=200917 RepID=A0A9P0JYX2_ACAOB|nr:unnamed protein product [Acanthoscelides obtectus]CAK1631428.1 Circadian clock-controlled protein [Acanthoscelides obtectus]
MQFIAYIVVLLGLASARKLPSYIQVCRRDDSTVGDCVLKNLEVIRPKLAQGIPEMSIPSLNPLEIPAATLDSGGSFKADFKNIRVYGGDKFVVKKFDLTVKDKFHFDLDLYLNDLRIICDYKIDGNILVLRLNGHGLMTANMTDIVVHVSTDGKMYDKNGKQHVSFTNSQVDNLVIKKARFQLDNIFGDNEQLNVQTNQVLNDSSEELIKELTPVITSVTRDIVFGIAEKTLQRYTFDELFPQ